MSVRTTLTPIQERALALIAAGATLNFAALEVGVHRNTIGNWLRSSGFREALAAAHYSKIVLWRDEAETLAADAIETIRAILTDPQAPVAARLKAASFVLDRVVAPLPGPPEANETAPVPETTHNPAQPADEPQPAPPVARPAGNGDHVPFRHGPKTGRNGNCPCGSGKKYKRCCLGKPAPANVSAPPES